jgi:uncharacterized protein (DUF4415 family)
MSEPLFHFSISAGISSGGSWKSEARRITPSEVIAAEQAIQEQFGINYTRRGRPVKSETEKYQSVSIRLHPQVITWAKSEAEKQGVGYQTIINEALLKLVS